MLCYKYNKNLTKVSESVAYQRKLFKDQVHDTFTGRHVLFINTER